MNNSTYMRKQRARAARFHKDQRETRDLIDNKIDIELFADDSESYVDIFFAEENLRS